MNKNAIQRITKALCTKYWFGGRAHYPWHHPINNVKDALLIHLDGCCQYKFKVHKNGKLRLMKVYTSRWITLGLRPLQTITVDELIDRILGNNNRFAPSHLKAAI